MHITSITRLSGILVAAVLLAYSPSIQAADAAKPAPDAAKKIAAPEGEKKTKPAEKAVRFPFHGKLKEVDAKKGTVTVHGAEKDRVFKITSETVITKHGKKATLAEGKVDEEVAGYCERHANGSVVALKLRFGPKPADEKEEDHSAHAKKPEGNHPPKPAPKQ